jgi:hypothetical protein
MHGNLPLPNWDYSASSVELAGIVRLMVICLRDDDGAEDANFEYLVKGLDIPAEADEAGTSTFTRFGPDATGWVIEVWFRPLPIGSSKPQRPIYWHGPPECRASNLNESVAVFPADGSARVAFQSCCLPLPRVHTRWSAVTIEDAFSRFSPYPTSHGWGWGRVISA